MPHDHHDHSHDTDGLSPSGHPYRPDQDHKLTRWQAMEIAMRELLVEKGIVTAAEITETVEQMDRRSPADGAKVVARAWVDPSFKARLLENGTEAIRELGIEPGVLKLIAVENTARTHNVVVCTLCSCYPRNLLGLPPDWYKQRAYRSRVVKTPRKVLAEFGLELPESTQVRVHDSTADMRYLVVPARPEGTEGLDEAALAELVSRDAMIGVATARHP
ncbi:nitrile hydratase subunit alpha [Neptunicoccus cionae]|uniref:nitrile hydratase subunit alpha n=1 Tax=Neptunicoccus cionae TaxID=2035344 RepID=UPI000C7845AE|nr:nitrile hydratase subunit alpha [Amylibacter cionae]PLS22019.1 nitrile hydratase subunit alpha [Amylibacter cionae]